MHVLNGVLEVFNCQLHKNMEDMLKLSPQNIC